MRRPGMLAISIWALCGFANGQGDVDFDRVVRPILSENCFACHGPDGSSRKAGLRLDRREDATAPRRRGVAIDPGAPDSSLLVERISHANPKKVMPPPDSGKSLTEDERAVLIRWIEAGAAWEEHWSFVAPTAVTPPPTEWGHDAIDAFVAAELAVRGLEPSPAADPRTLARRVALDLTGLPPTANQVASLVTATDPAAAYERLVDELLASPRHAEHMARYWLDAARYGDTHGLHLDNYREMWPYRDWVIQAFRDNKPYDEFVVEQLAGDLLPDPTLDQRIASGFNRCHVTTNEGGSIEEEVYVRNVVDRVNTAGTVFLGLTVGCAACHDHKFDPLSQREYYRLFAFFNNLDGEPMDGNKALHAPVVRIPSESHETRIAGLQQDITEVERRIAESLATVDYREPDPSTIAPGERRTIVWIDDALPPGARAEGDGLYWVESPRGLVHHGRLALTQRGEGHGTVFFKHAEHKLRLGGDDTLFAWVYLDPENPPRELMLQFNSTGSQRFGHRAYWGENLIEVGRAGSQERVHLGDLPEPGVWTRLEVPASAVGLWPDMAVHGLSFDHFDGAVHWDEVGVESTADQAPVDWTWIDDAPPRGARLQGDGPTWNWVSAPDHPVRTGDHSLRRRGGDGLNQDFFTDANPLPIQAGDRLFAHVWLDPADPPRSVQLQFHNGHDWNHRARWGEPAHGAGAARGADFIAGDRPPTGEWVRLEVAIEDVDLKPGHELKGWAFTQVGGTVYWDDAGVRTHGPPSELPARSQLAWERRAVIDDSTPKHVRSALEVEEAQRTDWHRATIRTHYLRHVFAGTRDLIDPLHAEIEQLRAQIKTTREEIPTTLVMKELGAPRAAYVLERGQYDARGDEVSRGTPAALPPMDAALPVNRLGLARWLTDPEHPLTARVAVNRFWQQVFGTGIVKTSEDFGVQGERPSHPELLDWLSHRFVAEGWDVRALMKRIVMSATYRQTARVDAARLAADPENRWLSRGPRFRLDAETLRDQALAVSGLLVERIGGPPVKPPQPAGLWKAVAYVGSNTETFAADTEPEAVHRRSIYTFWKRTAPPPQMSIFDAPSREECRVRRERTNTPLQALALLNDPQYLEAARALARRVLGEGGSTTPERAHHLFEQVTCRPPSAADLDELEALFADLLADYRDRPAEAAALAGEHATDAPDPVVAAWTLLANLVLNLDEVVTKG